VVVDGSPPLDGRRLFAVGGDLPPLETEVVADVAPPVGLPDRLVADPSGPAHDPTPANATVGTATTLATVIRRSPAPLSRSSTTASTGRPCRLEDPGRRHDGPDAAERQVGDLEVGDHDIGAAPTPGRAQRLGTGRLGQHPITPPCRAPNELWR